MQLREVDLAHYMHKNGPSDLKDMLGVETVIVSWFLTSYIWPSSLNCFSELLTS